MSYQPNTNLSFHKQSAGITAGITAALLLGIAALLPSTASAGSQAAPELLGASKKSVGRILGDGEPLVGGLFNEDASEHYSGGIGSTHAYRTRIGYIEGRSCYAFFMKKTGESFKPVEIFGLLYLCANRAEWSAVEVWGDKVGLIYRATSPKGAATGQTYLATTDDTGRRLFVYSPDWRPDFDRELWITPDEAPVHRETERMPMIEKGSGLSNAKGEIGKQRRHSNTKGGSLPEVTDTLFGKPSGVPAGKGGYYDSKGGVPNAKQAGGDPKQGVYLPKLNKVIPAAPSKNPKATKQRDKRKRGKQRTKPITVGK